jgi:chromosomal replication initiation ATPase DnaA
LNDLEALTARIERLERNAFGIIADLIGEAARRSGFSVAEVRGRRRTAHLNTVRFAIAWVAAAKWGRSPTDIGRALGGRDHTTILNALASANLKRQVDAKFGKFCDDLLAWTKGF